MTNKIFFSLLIIGVLAACTSGNGRIKADSGYEYEVIRKGNNEPIPMDSYVFFHMSLTQGDSVIQSTITSGQPSVLKLTEDNTNYGQLEALVDIMATLSVGDSLLFYFPIDSFEQLPPGFDAFTEDMIYRVGITEVMNEEQFNAFRDSVKMEQEKEMQLVKARLPEIEAMTAANWEKYKSGGFDGQIQRTASGLRYIIHEEGDGPKPLIEEPVSVHYYGMLDEDAKVFDTSFKMGQPYRFPLGVGQVIQGWDEGLQLLPRGTKATLLIPSDLAYGAAGSPPMIPENADLIFYVELEK